MFKCCAGPRKETILVGTPSGRAPAGGETSSPAAGDGDLGFGAAAPWPAAGAPVPAVSGGGFGGAGFGAASPALQARLQQARRELGPQQQTGVSLLQRVAEARKLEQRAPSGPASQTP